MTAVLVAGGDDPDARRSRGSRRSRGCKGLAEAASELRRHLLDRLRAGDLAKGEELLGVMDDVYDALVVIDYPDAITGGLRRDARRAAGRAGAQPRRRHHDGAAGAAAAGHRVRPLIDAPRQRFGFFAPSGAHAGAPFRRPGRATGPHPTTGPAEREANTLGHRRPSERIRISGHSSVLSVEGREGTERWRSADGGGSVEWSGGRGDRPSGSELHELLDDPEVAAAVVVGGCANEVEVPLSRMFAAWGPGS